MLVIYGGTDHSHHILMEGKSVRNATQTIYAPKWKKVLRIFFWITHEKSRFIPKVSNDHQTIKTALEKRALLLCSYMIYFTFDLECTIN